MRHRHASVIVATFAIVLSGVALAPRGSVVAEVQPLPEVHTKI